MESLSDREILETCWSLLKQYVGPGVPRPTSCSPTRWASNNNARGEKYLRSVVQICISISGSYSYSTPECDRRDIGPHHLAAPCTDSAGRQKLFFCGEVRGT